MLSDKFLWRLTCVALGMSFLFVTESAAANFTAGVSSASGRSSSASLQLHAVIGQPIVGIQQGVRRQYTGAAFAHRQLELTSPNGGEMWRRDLQYAITWRATPAVGAVHLEISTNAGLSFAAVTNSQVNGGSFSWTVNAAASSQAIVRVSAATIAGLHDLSDNVFNILPAASLAVRPEVWLQAAMQGQKMRTELYDRAYLPIAQPFNSAPLNYAGTETRAAMLDSLVDWVLIELRSGDNNTQAVARRAALLHSDGTISDPSGADAVLFDAQLAAGDYYIVVWQRNHLGVMSSAKVALGNGNDGVYDFRTARGQAWREWSDPQADLGQDRFGLFGGDANPNGFINAADRVATRSRVFEVGYVVEDVNLDGVVNAGDRVVARNNSFRISNIP